MGKIEKIKQWVRDDICDEELAPFWITRFLDTPSAVRAYGEHLAVTNIGTNTLLLQENQLVLRGNAIVLMDGDRTDPRYETLAVFPLITDRDELLAAVRMALEFLGKKAGDGHA